MAIYSIAVTYPDAAQARVLNALKARYASNGTPNPTNAQALEALSAEVRGIVKGIVLSYEQQAAAATAVPVDVT